MPYYWLYYLLPIVVAFANRNPKIALVAIGFVVVRPWLPDPVVLLRAFARAGALKRQAELNAANVTARRDLGALYLDLLRPRAALRFLDEARARDARNQDVAFLRGRALLLCGDAEGALRAFGEAVGIDPDAGEPFSSQSVRGNARAFTRFADAFLGAAVALERLQRLPQAEEALGVAASFNSSMLEPRVRLAQVRKRRGDREGARAAIVDARRTFAQLPRYAKRKQLRWWLRTWLMSA
jgi:tetratricopeptide (TPR) repeat protein